MTKLPSNLSVGRNLDLWDTRITKLPSNLSVGGKLILRDTRITELPSDLSVGGGFDLHGTGIKPIFIDERNYELYHERNWYISGCRFFPDAESAIAHWGAKDYPSKCRGAKFVEAIQKEESKRDS